VLQDDGYVVRFGDTSLGLLSASKNVTEVDVYNFPLLGETSSNLLDVEASANVSRYGQKTRVRVNFERKITTREGQWVDAPQVNNAKFYQEFFAKVDKELFIESEGL